jgi:two-component system response regulator FixJ
METPGTDNYDARKATLNQVFIIDDDAEIRDLLRSVLEAAGFHVEAFNSAAKFLSDGGAAKAGCLLTDVRMTGMSGLELQKELRRLGARIAVVLMTGHSSIDVAVRAMQAGAIDFLEKPFGTAVLLESVGRALEFVSRTEASSSLVKIARNRVALLTKREKEVLDLVVTGDTNKTVARELRISPRTVEIHRARAISKMGTRSLVELVRMSIAGVSPHPQG